MDGDLELSKTNDKKLRNDQLIRQIRHERRKQNFTLRKIEKKRLEIEQKYKHWIVDCYERNSVARASFKVSCSGLINCSQD